MRLGCNLKSQDLCSVPKANSKRATNCKSEAFHGKRVLYLATCWQEVPTVMQSFAKSRTSEGQMICVRSRSVPNTPPKGTKLKSYRCDNDCCAQKDDETHCA
eukprot:5239641-Amphidinium_carterae.1